MIFSDSAISPLPNIVIDFGFNELVPARKRIRFGEYICWLPKKFQTVRIHANWTKNRFSNWNDVTSQLVISIHSMRCRNSFPKTFSPLHNSLAVCPLCANSIPSFGKIKFRRFMTVSNIPMRWRGYNSTPSPRNRNSYRLCGFVNNFLLRKIQKKN